jgi:hypothetical protein
MPAPQLHLSFGMSIQDRPGIAPALRRACASEPVYTRLGSIFHDLPYYGNMLLEAARYGLRAAALDEPWAYRMHSVRPARFVASYVRAAHRASLTSDEKLALVGGLASHCALDLTLHPLVNYCARSAVAREGGHESVHHRLTEKFHALFFHVETLGDDLIGSPRMRTWTRVVKRGSLVAPRVEAPLADFMGDAYRGAYGDAPEARTWAGWVRSFAHFGLLVSSPLARRNSETARRDPALRARYFENEQFRFFDFYACSERRLTLLCNLAYDYFEAGDFSPRAEEAFVAASTIDDLAEPEPLELPSLPRLRVVSTPGVTRPAMNDGESPIIAAA